ncbi:unnamed protein product [Moneuplotes crassus]|uniref:Uncharacterized protein n=1 Tax=Euplotes crassus TaxID=5936 RepID=A0AAD2CXP2_EUPCR|nr:unnamed protein product [Moneuplotes crassus]
MKTLILLGLLLALCSIGKAREKITTPQGCSECLNQGKIVCSEGFYEPTSYCCDKDEEGEQCGWGYRYTCSDRVQKSEGSQYLLCPAVHECQMFININKDYPIEVKNTMEELPYCKHTISQSGFDNYTLRVLSAKTHRAKIHVFASDFMSEDFERVGNLKKMKIPVSGSKKIHLIVESKSSFIWNPSYKLKLKQETYRDVSDEEEILPSENFQR